MRVLICGDRNWVDKEKIKFVITSLGLQHSFVIIHGDARGADRLGAQAAIELSSQHKILAFPADWDKYGKAAGHIRNQQMLNEGKPNLVLAFHSDIANSKGTKDMIFRANKAGIEVRLYG